MGDRISKNSFEESCEKLRKGLLEWDQKNQNEFKKTVKTLKYLFKDKGLVLPRDWKEVYLEWYIHTLDEDESWKVSFDDLIAKLTDRKIILEWAEIYTKELISKNSEIEKPEKGESNAVKWLLLDEFFNGNREFEKLRIKDQEKLLGIIFGCRADTVKHIRNNMNKNRPDGKHITQASLDRFSELSDKIKKGEYL